MEEDNELSYRFNGWKMTVVYPSRDRQGAISGIDRSAAKREFLEVIMG